MEAAEKEEDLYGPFDDVSELQNVVYMNIAWESMIVLPKDITFIILYIMKR